MSMEESVDFGLNMEMIMGLMMLLILVIAIIVVTVRGLHAPLARCGDKDLGQPGEWAPCRAFLSVPFDSQQEECQCQSQHPCQHSQPHSPPNIVLFVSIFIQIHTLTSSNYNYFIGLTGSSSKHDQGTGVNP